MLAASSIYEHPALSDSDIWSISDKHPQSLLDPFHSKSRTTRVVCGLLGLAAIVGTVAYFDFVPDMRLSRRKWL
ncbi:hypothetical protein E4T56_gene20535 [Termitomyces sp. T112]|nr:hypothetical protein E4T56_gene20535 [Termitomyces sp. T112]